MKRYTTVIVEDEELPLLSLIQKLKEYHPEIEIAGTCGNAETALETVLKVKPDILFLDIQLSGAEDSLWLLEQLEISIKKMPYIIFTTAYNNPEYLLKAIKFQTVDYLLKPVGIVNLAKAIIRMKEKAEQNTGISGKKYSFHTFNSTLLVAAVDIVYCAADGNYCKMFIVQNTEEAIFERLGEVEEKLASTELFVRAGKSHLINKQYIYKIDAKKQICYLKSLADSLYRVEISAGGIAVLKNEFKELEIRN